MLKKFLAIVVTIVLVLVSYPVVCFGEGQVFEIWNDEDFLMFADSINRGNSFYKDTVVLQTNIDTTKFSDSFGLLGENTTAFCGKFDGRGHTIKLLFNKKPLKKCTGLFWGIAGATICNLNICGEIEGGFNVGSISAYSEDSLVINCANCAMVNGQYAVGGFVGIGRSTVFIECTNSGMIKADDEAGPFCGRNSFFLDGRFVRSDISEVCCTNNGVIINEVRGFSL